MPNIILSPLIGVDHSSALHLVMHQTQQSINFIAGDGGTHMTISWRIHRVMLMKQAPCIMAMCIDLQHRHNHYNKHNKNSNKDGREGGVWRLS